jgi:hypothetical protein
MQPQNSNRFFIVFRLFSWIAVLELAAMFFGYIALATVWLMLGAIVNPIAFLPYATGAATFFTIVSAQAAQFNKISGNG